MIAAMVLKYNTVLLALDPDFERLEKRIEIEWLGAPLDGDHHPESCLPGADPQAAPA
jgi:hypothetical protein